MKKGVIAYLSILLVASVVSCSKPQQVLEVQENQQVYLDLGDKQYFSVLLPANLEIRTDYDSYVMTSDNSLVITVMDCETKEDLSSVAAIKGGDWVANNVILARYDNSPLCEAAAYFSNQKAVIVRSSKNTTEFQQVVDSLITFTVPVKDSDSFISQEYTKYLDAVPTYSEAHLDAEKELGSVAQKVYKFEDGTLTISREFRGFSEAVKNILSKLIVAVNDSVATNIYETEEVFYMEVGDFTVAVIHSNFSTCLTFFGEGLESRCLITEYLQ